MTTSPTALEPPTEGRVPADAPREADYVSPPGSEASDLVSPRTVSSHVRWDLGSLEDEEGEGHRPGELLWDEEWEGEARRSMIADGVSVRGVRARG
jgi:hypothetical protein